MQRPEQPIFNRHAALWAGSLAGIMLVGEAAARLLIAQDAGLLATVIRFVTLLASAGWALGGLVSLARPDLLWQTTLFGLGLLAGGSAAAEGLARTLGVGWGLAAQLATLAGIILWTWKLFRRVPQWRAPALVAIATAGVAATIWLLVRHGWLIAATGLTGIGGMALGCVLGLAAIRFTLGGTLGIAAVARTVIEEAVRMRVALALLVLLVVSIPMMPLVLDHTERLEYRVQFFLNWALGGASLILSLMTIFLACGSVCGDIDSYRIHMTLAKPLNRWEYLIGKWLGIALFNLLLVGLAGAGTYTFVRVLQATVATDQADRDAVDRQVLTARTGIGPVHENSEDYEASIAAAIDRLQKDDPDAFASNPEGVRARIRREYDWAWHTVTADAVSTYIFQGLEETARTKQVVQLQLKPRANNVEVDLAEMGFALWLNDRPWPMQDGKHVEQRVSSGSTVVLEIPSAMIDEAGRLKVGIGNRNLVPPGETLPTAITFRFGDGLRLFHRVGGFDGNFLRCLTILWIKLAMVAAAGVAAATCLGFPTATLLGLVIYFTALGSGFFKEGMGLYNVVAESTLGLIGKRLALAGGYAVQFRFYEAFRMLFGFVNDFVLWMIPAFSDYDAVSNLATGLVIPTSSVLSCLLKIGIIYPLALGLLGWLAFDRRDLIRSTT